MQHIAIIIPSYNEEKRIENTIKRYLAFFSDCTDIQYTLIVVLNGSIDNTKQIVLSIKTDKEKKGNANLIHIVEIAQAGKGLAVKEGFAYALQQNIYSYIGFVDADMATEPQYFYDLVKHIDGYDGVIASRYIKGARIQPTRPLIKRWGSKLIYESLIWLLFGMKYKDYQCGAKLFTTSAIARIVPYLTVKQWAFDVELLYICKKNGLRILEHPTVWYDRAGSKLKITHGIFMLGNLFQLRFKHSMLYFFHKKN